MEESLRRGSGCTAVLIHDVLRSAEKPELREKISAERQRLCMPIAKMPDNPVLREVRNRRTRPTSRSFENRELYLSPAQLAGEMTTDSSPRRLRPTLADQFLQRRDGLLAGSALRD
jgi:hypothetical protein